jgi:alanine racemase
VTTVVDDGRDDGEAMAALGEAVVDLGAIAHNTEVLAEHSRGAMMAVVKADGFGHGMLEVATTALAHGATWLGVTSLAEAARLRAAGVTAPVLSWLHLPDQDFRPAITADVDLSVASLEHLAGVAACAERAGTRASVHLKIDTGLSRNGSPAEDWPALVAAARRCEQAGLVTVRGVWSHLASADRPGDPSVPAQLRRYEEALALARAAGLDPEWRHVANSAGIVAVPDSHYDLTRAGIGIYGVEPIAGREHGLRPAMTLRTRTIMVKRVAGGTGVSYEHEYVTGGETTLALVPLGFADGVPRLLGNRGEVLVNGTRGPIAGRVAMDQFVVDVGDASVRIGDEVLLFGTGERGEPTAAQWAAWARTNAHEILTGIGGRVPRRYLPSGARPAGDRSGRVPERSDRTRVAVVFGGRSGEHDVSSHSAESVLANLDRDRYEVVPVRIARDGVWTVGEDGDELLTGHGTEVAVPGVPADLWRSMAGAVELLRTVDVVFPVLHGAYGEDGTIQSLLEIADIPYVGNGVIASAVGMDKEFTKKILAADGLPVARSVVLHAQARAAADVPIPMDEVRGLGLPVFVKPARSGSSLGVSKVSDWDELPAAVAASLAVDSKVLIEEAVLGREVDLGVLEHPDGRLEAGPPLEITVPDGHVFFDYDAKYEDTATVFEIPAKLTPELTTRLQDYAVRVFESLGCSGLLRIDFFLRDGVHPVINEVNTFPGFTAASQYPQIWQVAGFSFPALLDVLIATALARAADRVAAQPAAAQPSTAPGIGR